MSTTVKALANFLESLGALKIYVGILLDQIHIKKKFRIIGIAICEEYANKQRDMCNFYIK